MVFSERGLGIRWCGGGVVELKVNLQIQHIKNNKCKHSFKSKCIECSNVEEMRSQLLYEMKCK